MHRLFPAEAGRRVVYYFTKAQWGLDAVRDQRIKLSTLDDLNDPFELYAADLTDKEQRQVAYDFKARLGAIWGLLCCSKSWDQTLMWSHYADRHRGVALVLDVEATNLTDIHYCSERKRFTAADYEKPLKSRMESPGPYAMCTKAECWHYEDEARTQFPLDRVTKDGDLFFTPFHDAVRLVGVLLGPLCKIKDDDIGWRMHPDQQLTVARTRIAFGSFRVVPRQDAPHTEDASPSAGGLVSAAKIES